MASKAVTVLARSAVPRSLLGKTGVEASANNDVWAAGVVLFELLFDGAWIVPGVYASPSGDGGGGDGGGADGGGGGGGAGGVGLTAEDRNALQQLVQLLDGATAEVIVRRCCCRCCRCDW